jgi:hypothetical protein
MKGKGSSKRTFFHSINGPNSNINETIRVITNKETTYSSIGNKKTKKSSKPNHNIHNVLKNNQNDVMQVDFFGGWYMNITINTIQNIPSM